MKSYVKSVLSAILCATTVVTAIPFQSNASEVTEEFALESVANEEIIVEAVTEEDTVSEDINGNIAKATRVAEGIIQAGDMNVTGGQVSKARYFSEIPFVVNELYSCMKEKQTYVDLTNYTLTADELHSAVVIVVNDNPDLYYVDRTYNYNYDTFTGIVTGIEILYVDGLDDSQYEKAIEKALSIITPGMTTLDKVIAIHDYLALTAEYDESLYYGMMPPEGYSSYGILVNHIGVCQGYALAFKDLCNRLGIECYFVRSESMDHGWNLVNIDGDYYHVDVTWDDPLKDRFGMVEHRYMLLSDVELGYNGHYDYNVILGDKEFPEDMALSDKYDNAFWNGVRSPLVYSDNAYYYIMGNGIFSRDRNFNSEKELLQMNDRWCVNGQADWIYSDSFSGLTLVNNRLYYNTPSEIRSFSVNNNRDDRREYEINTSYGYIYGTYLSNNQMQYSVKFDLEDGFRTIESATIDFNATSTDNNNEDVTVSYYIIEYVLNGGDNNIENPDSYTESSKAITLKNPTRTGYSFNGWYSDSSLTKKVKEIAAGSTGNKTFYAKWTPISYKVVFKGNDANSGSMDSKTYKYDTSYTLPANKFVKNDFEFAGWNTKADGSGDQYSNKDVVMNLTSDSGKTVTLYAQWKQGTHAIIYNLNGGVNNSANPAYFYEDSADIVLAEAARTGYKFAGWYSDSSLSKRYSTIPAGTLVDVTVYAKWTPINFYISFKGNTSTSGSMDKQKYVYDNDYNLPKCSFKKSGYTFVGWNTKADGTGEFYADEANIRNITSESGKTISLYAQWTKK